MRYPWKKISAVALIASAACVTSPDATQTHSIYELLANPSEFDGRSVVIVAYANIEFEGDELCEVPGAGRNGCIWLTYDDGPWETEKDWARYQAADLKWRAFHGKRVFVRGTFNSGPSGHFGMYLGDINHITEVKLAP